VWLSDFPRVTGENGSATIVARAAAASLAQRRPPVGAAAEAMPTGSGRFRGTLGAILRCDARSPRTTHLANNSARGEVLEWPNRADC
jgi:hypothetical protein